MAESVTLQNDADVVRENTAVRGREAHQCNFKALAAANLRKDTVFWFHGLRRSSPPPSGGRQTRRRTAGRHSSRKQTRWRVLLRKKPGQLFYVAHAGVLYFLSRNLLDRSHAHAGARRYVAPAPLPFLQLFKDVRVKAEVHPITLDPFTGFSNPLTGLRGRYAFSPMGNPKRPKVPDKDLRQILATNVKNLLDKHFPGKNQEERLAEATGVCSQSTVQRLLAGVDPDSEKASAGSTVDTLGHIAKHLKVAPYQLLVPNLDAANPQMVKLPKEVAQEWKETLNAAIAQIDQAAAGGQVIRLEANERSLKPKKQQRHDAPAKKGRK